MSEAKEVPIKSEIITPSLLISSLKLFKALPIKNQKKQENKQIYNFKKEKKEIIDV